MNIKTLLIPLLLCLVVLVGLFPALRATYELNDDHTLIRNLSNRRIHDQVPPRQAMTEQITCFAGTHGRFIPVLLVVSRVRMALVGQNTVANRAIQIAAAFATTILFYLASSQAFKTPVVGGFFALSLMQCPAANDVWPHLIRGESWGMLMTAATLFCIVRATAGAHRELYDVVGVLCFLIACLSKESFVLLAPALAWLRWRWDAQTPEHERNPRGSSWLFPASGYILAAFAVGLTVLFVMSSAGSSSHGARSLQVDPSRVLPNLIVILESLPRNAVFFLPVLGLVLCGGAALKGVVKTQITDIAFSALIILPQIGLYVTRDSFEQRYAFPMLIGFAWVNAIALREIFHTERRVFVRLAVAFCVGAYLLRCAQVQFTESQNLAADTRRISALCADVARRIPERGTIVIVSPEKTEHAVCVLHQLGLSGRPHTRVYLDQPRGANDAFCFTGFTEMAELKPQTVDAVIYLRSRTAAALDNRSWYEAKRFTPSIAESKRRYVSLRNFALNTVTIETQYDVVLESERKAD